MAGNAELYHPQEKYQAFHAQAGIPGEGQWWFHDGHFTNGYSLELMFHIAPGKSSIWLDVCGPDGKLTHATPFFDTNRIFASTETLDVRMGDNRMQGTFPRYELHFREGDVGADLVYECLTQPVFEPPDGVYLGREQAPATPLYFAYVMRPRCRITGTLTIAGKEIPVEGEGYADHQWKYVPPGQFQHHYWYWGKVYLPHHTLIWWDTQLNQTFGFQRFKWLWALSGNKLIEYSSHAAMYVELADFAVTPETGARLPRKMVLMLDEPQLKGTATFTVKHIVKNVPLAAFGVKTEAENYQGAKHYARFLSTCHSDFEIEGKRVVADSVESHEIGI